MVLGNGFGRAKQGVRQVDSQRLEIRFGAVCLYVLGSGDLGGKLRGILEMQHFEREEIRQRLLTQAARREDEHGRGVAKCRTISLLQVS